MKPTIDPPAELDLQCMEIWGGSHAVEKRIAMPGLDAWVFSRPYHGEASGGDVHYVSLCGGGIVTRLLVADVSGHGSAVAEFAGSLRELMRQNINSESQVQLVRALNRQFAELAQSRRFATAIVATYLATHACLAVCNAGHPRPLWYRADLGRWELLTPEAGEPVTAMANLPLGLDEETPYDQFAIAPGKGDVLLFYTDALIEASDASGRMLGEEGLLEVARGLDMGDPGRVGPALLAGVDRHSGGRASDDDMTLLALHHTAAGPRRLSVAEKLDVYAKVFGMEAEATTPEVVRGVIHGRTIELMTDPGIEDGQLVEVVVRRDAGPPARVAGPRASAGSPTHLPPETFEEWEGVVARE